MDLVNFYYFDACIYGGFALVEGSVEWCLKSYQHILGYLMTFSVLLVEEDLRIIQIE